MNKILPLNLENFEGVYPDNIFFNSICSSNIAGGKLLAQISIQDYCLYNWRKLTHNITVMESKTNIEVYGRENDNIMTAYLYRDCYVEDELIITIYLQQYTFAWATISIFLAKTEQIEDGQEIGAVNGDLKAVILEFGHFSKKKIYLAHEGKIIKDYDLPSHIVLPILLKMKRSGRNIQFYVSVDNVSWINFDSIELPDLKISFDQLVTGVIFNMGERQWLDWKYLNSIQLYSPKAYVRPNYFYMIRKENRDNLINMLLNYNNEYIYNIHDYICSFTEYLKINIDRNLYCQLKATLSENGFLIGNLSNTDDCAILIYGYNDEKAIFYAVQVDYTNISLLKIGYSLVEKYQQRAQYHEYVRLIEYNPHGGRYELDIEIMVEFLREYIDGENSFNRFLYDLPKNNKYICGIKIYDELLNCSEIFFQDKRIIYLLCEHKRLMIDRLEYLFIKNIITKKSYDEIIGEFKMIYTISESIKENIEKKEDNTKILLDEIRDMIMKMKDIEFKAYSKLIDILKMM